MKCKNLNASVTITTVGYSGTYTTTNPTTANSYSYYSGNPDKYNTHFTVTPTGGGNGDFTSFHISLNFSSNGSRNAHIWYNNGVFGSINYPNLTTSEKQAFDALFATDQTKFDAMAMEFWKNVQPAKKGRPYKSVSGRIIEKAPPLLLRRPETAPIDRTAISPYDNYCDGYSRTGSIGNGYVSVLKVSTGQVEKTDDFLLDGIVAYDRAEANDAYIGQINMETASSFCGIAGQIWGFDLATADIIKQGGDYPLFYASQYDGSSLPVYDAQPLLDAGISLFGTEHNRNYPPAPGGHIICANKSVTASRPVSGVLQEGQAYGVWCYIAISITRDRENSADLFIEDAGLWTQDDNEANLKNFLDQHRRSVAWSITACGEDQNVLYQRTYIAYSYIMMTPGNIGTALTCAPYVTLAKNAVPGGNQEGFSKLNDMTLSEWKASQS